MSKRPWLRFGFIVPMLAALLLMIAVSCGDDDAPAVSEGAGAAEAAAASAAASQAAKAAETAAMAAEEAAAQAAELSAAAKAAGNGESEAVKAALAAAAQASKAAETAAMAAQEAAAQAAVVPTPAPQSVTAAKVEPFGELNIGFKEFGNYAGHTRLTTYPAFSHVSLAAFEGLVQINDSGRFIPMMMKEWSVAPDNVTWTFKLHDGIKFHGDVGPVTPEDVIYSVRQTGAADGNCGCPQIALVFDNPEGYFIGLDDTTLELSTGVPSWQVLPQINIPNCCTPWIFSKNQWEQLVAEVGEDAALAQLVGTGPWELVEQRTGEFWKFKAVNPHYRKVSEFAEMNFLEIPEESTRIANFQVGKIDTFSAAPDTVPALAADPDTKFMSQGGASVSVLLTWGNYTGAGTDEQWPNYDPDSPWISSNPDPASPEWDQARKVRQAISQAIDREKIVEELLGGEGEPALMWGWQVFKDRWLPDWKWEFDLERARELMKEAGYEDGFDVEITPAVRGAPAEVEACEAVADMLADININASIRTIPFGTLGVEYQARTVNGFTCHPSPPVIEPNVLWGLTYDPRGSWSVGFDHPFFTPNLDEIVATFDDDERWRLQLELGDWMFKNALDIGLYAVNAVYPLGPKLDSWAEHLSKGDSRRISALEYAPHRR